MLLNRKASLTHVNHHGWTATYMAIAHGQEECLKSLMTAKADVLTERDTQGNTPLHWSTQFGNMAVTNSLIAAQCDPDLRNYSDLTPLDTAQEHEIVKA